MNNLKNFGTKYFKFMKFGGGGGFLLCTLDASHREYLHR